MMQLKKLINAVRKSHFLNNCIIYQALFLLFAAGLASAADFYWEEPELFYSGTGNFPVSAFSGSLSALAWQETSPNRNPNSTAGGFINICLAVKTSGKSWEHRGTAAGPYAYSGTEPSIISMVIDNRDRIIIAAAASGNQAEILISEDKGISFTRQTVNLGSDNSVAPRIYVRADGGYLLFVTRGLSQALSIYYSRSDDGKNWSPLELFVSDNNLILNFLPSHASIEQRDVVFFQSLVMGLESFSTFQLFYKTSDDNGKTWSAARRFTTFNDPIMQTQAPPDRFDNQRPHLTVYGNSMFLVWERRYGSQPPQIYSATIDSRGSLIGHVERVNSEEAFCNNPIGFIHEKSPTVVWFDNRRGNNRVTLAQRGDFDWQNQQVSGVSVESSFARPVLDQDGIFVFWQSLVRGVGRIYLLSPDRSVDSPRITPLNFAAGRPNRSERARVSWNIPADTSGVFGFSWSWSQDKTDNPPKQVMVYNTGSTQNLNLDLNAGMDGPWYFSVLAQDFAGNWSEPARVEYYRKTTGPAKVDLADLELDGNGYIKSNNFDLAWIPSSDPFLSGYTWNLQFLGNDENGRINAPPSRNMGISNSVRYANQDNGVWAFTVAAIDAAGNIGEQSNIVFKANKFIPFTNVSYVDARQDEQGILSIRIIGRGFSTGGQVTAVVLEPAVNIAAPGNEPELRCDFKIQSDREIGDIRLDNLDEGQYRLKLEHSVRGWYTAPVNVNVSRTGTVKFGDYSLEWKPSWSLESSRKLSLNPVKILVFMLIVFCALGSIAAMKGIGSAIAESIVVRQETLAIITGDFMPMEKKKRITQIQKKGRGLRFKLVSFTMGLVLLVVIMVSSPIYMMMINTQRKTMLQGLWDRSTVLLEGLASSARAYLPSGNYTELGYLPAQSSSIPEAHYVTIAGYGTGSIYADHVWATNDPDILAKIDTTEFRPGISRINDVVNLSLEEISKELNDLAHSTDAANLSQSISELYQEGVALALRTDRESIRRRDDIQASIRSLEARLSAILAGISKIGSQPDFTSQRLARDGEYTYIFYKPVMYRLSTDDNFFRGLVLLELSVDTLVEDLFQAQQRLLLTILFVAMIALLMGFVGALTLSMLIIKPIRKLVNHIEMIRDTEDKAKLQGLDINLTTGDELAVLGSTINDMTHGLVKAALAASDLSIGKEIQKKFIPLGLDSQGNKQTSGFKKTANLNFFGYYEGAKGVSGDYFDYRDLDGRYFAIIKCDVAGKGIPAALIMIQVATMFLNYFKQWKPNAKGMRIEEVVYQINEFIETLAFKGRFAAFTLCLFDSVTGTARFCNAGDNIVHLYDASERRLKTITFPQSPATGVLPNFMIESTGGYSVQTLTIDKGDILLLYTDGIEEAKRRFRNSDFKEIVCTEGPADTPHDNHLCGQGDEEMSPERVEAIINAAMAGEVYTLSKHHNPEGDNKLQFDFSTCEGHVEDVIMAMVSVEKMFRCYKPADAGEDSRVLVDKKVDEFLKNHFLQYRRYCAHTREYPENPAYMYYTHVKEDEQYDDLTILGIKRT